MKRLRDIYFDPADRCRKCKKFFSKMLPIKVTAKLVFVYCRCGHTNVSRWETT